MNTKIENKDYYSNRGFNNNSFYLIRPEDNEIICRSYSEKSIKIQADHFKMMVGDCSLIIRDDQGNEKKY